MKLFLPKQKTTLFIVLFSITFKVFSQTTPIPDVNFENFLIAQGIDTNGVTGNILNADAQAVTNLNVTVTTITDFTGLEAFVNVTTMNLGTNQFATLPLSTLIALESLTFTNNDALASLDLTSNIALKILNIGSNPSGATPVPPITTLDLSQNTVLEDLKLYVFNNLSNLTLPVTGTLWRENFSTLAVPEFDLSLHNGLEEFTLAGSTAGSVNLILPNETNVLRIISLSSINFPDIDLSHYVALEHINLSSTFVENLAIPSTNTLTSVNVSVHELSHPISFAPAPNLTALSFTSNFGTTPLQIDLTSNVMLDRLTLTSDLINSIDLTQNVNLTYLSISSNNLTVLDVTHNTMLESLYADNNQLPDIDLTQNVLLKYLGLSYNLLTNSLDLSQNVNLNILSVNNNLFTTTGLDLSHNVVLNYINISNNQVESLDITHNVQLVSFVANHNLFSGTDILDQLYVIKSGYYGLSASNIIDVSFNNLSGTIPDFASLETNYTNYFRFKFNNNAFHFGDFEDQHDDYLYYMTHTNLFGTSSYLPIMTEYWYAPQAKVNEIENLTPNAGDMLTLLTEVRGAQNHYTWYKDGVAIPDSDSPEYIIQSTTSCDSGVYYCEITSDLVPFENSNPPGTSGKNLLLVRNDITVNVQYNENCVTLNYPADGATDVPINANIIWNVNPGACGYYISVGTSPGGHDIVNNINVGQTNTYVPTAYLPSNTILYVTITPYFSTGNASGCTEESFTTSNIAVAPDCTQITNPVNNATDVSITTNITWTSVSTATGYFLSVGTTSGGTDLVNNQDVGNVTTYDFPTDLPYNTTIYVTIIPYNTAGNAAGCLQESFTTEPEPVVIPNCTSLTLPVNNTTDVSITTNLTWTSVSTATGYFLSVGTTSGGTDILNATDVGNVTTYDFPTDLPYNTTIYVTIIPYNTAGNATGCTEESFTTEPEPVVIPNCTSLTLPVNNTTDVSITTNLTWTSVSTATGYFLSVGTTSGGTDILNVTDVGNVTTYDFPTDLPYNTTIYVTIIPYNTAGNAAGCLQESFTTEPEPVVIPNCTSLTLPVNNTTDVSITTNLTWTSVSTATGYFLSVGTTSGGTDILNATDVGNVTTYDFSTDLPYNTTIYVTIIPYNTAGNAAGCLQESFTTIQNTSINQTKYGISPDGDGINDYWEITGIDDFPDNKVSVFNRWGDMVYQAKNYNNYDVRFLGIANKLKNFGADILPEGTYFFTIEYKDGQTEKTVKGFIVLKR